MASVEVKVTIRKDWLDKQMRQGAELDAAFMRAAGRVRDRARQNIDKLGRNRTGRMKQAMVAERKDGYYQVRAAVPYSGYQESGTRAHGPRRARVLAFQNKAGQQVFAKRVRGVTAGHFMRDAASSLTSGDLRR